MNSDWLAVFESLKNVYTEGAYSNMAINEALLHHKGCSESFVRNYAKGVLRSTVKLDYLIDRLASRGIAKIAARPLILLRMGIYAIDSLGSVPDHAAVNEAVNLAKKLAKGSDKFVNGVLRTYLRDKDKYIIPEDRPDLKYSISKDIISLLSNQYGDETAGILKGLNEPTRTVIRVNKLLAERDDVIDRLTESGFDAEASDESENAILASGSGIVSSNLYREGKISLQSLSSMLAIEALGIKAGSKILDMCAAPGGKSAYIAELMGNSGVILSCDIHEHRLRLIERTMERLGIDIVATAIMDGSEYSRDMEGRFDYVIADVPCSGLGVMASKPEISFNSDPKTYDELIRIQTSILKNALRYVREGGRVEYSTCTLNREENERVVEKALSDDTGARVVEMRTLMPYNNKVGFYYCIIEKSTKTH